MDVTCERCSTEYEFDETLVSERGTTVKCTNCGHLFKVFRPGAGADGSGARPWMIRRADGTTEILQSLRDLQRRITEGKLKPTDEISRSGEGWKKLGDIAELQTFFAAARAAAAAGSAATATSPSQARTPPFGVPVLAKPALDPADKTIPFSAEATRPASGAPFARTPSSRASADADALARAQTALGTPLPAADGRGLAPRIGSIENTDLSSTVPTLAKMPLPPSVTQTPPQSPRGTVSGYGKASPSSPASDAAPGSRPNVRPPPPPPPPSRSVRALPNTADHTDRVGELVPPRSENVAPGYPGPGVGGGPQLQHSFQSAATMPALHVDEDDEPARPPRKRGLALWLAGAGVLVVVGVGVALGWSRLANGTDEDPALPFLTRGDEALARDYEDGYESAIREYTKALAFRERDARTLASLARAQSSWAQAIDFDADDREARAAADPSLGVQAEILRRDQRRHAEEARRYAEDAVRQSPASMEAELALSDALRMSGDLSGARSHLDRARALQRDPSAETLYVSALLEMERTNGLVSAARAGAEEAVHKDPTLLRARLLLARALLAQGDVSGARQHIEAVVARDQTHPRALALREAIEQGLPPAAPVVAVLDAGAAAPAEAQPALDAGAAAPVIGPVVVSSSGSSSGGGSAPAGRTYEWYVEQGNRLQDQNQPGRARAMYEAALRARPGGAEATCGIGYVEEDEGHSANAARQYQRAAQSGYADCWAALGDLRKRMRDIAGARSAYQQYLNSSPSGSEAGRIRRQMEQLDSEAAGTMRDGPDPSGGAPPSAPNELPAPRNFDPTNPPPSDTPAVGTE